MPKPSLDERINEIHRAIERYPALRSHLELHEAVFEAQRELRTTPGKGLHPDSGNRDHAKQLQLESEVSGQPVIRLLKRSIINEEVMRSTALRIVDTLIEHKISSCQALREKIRGNLVGTLLGAFTGGNDQEILDLAAEIKVDAHILVFLVQMLIQPWLEQVASEMDTSNIQRRACPTCPICGVKPIVEKTLERKRLLVCTLCGLSFPADPFSCIFCGNTNPYALKSLFPEDYAAFRIDYCEKCRHYTKVIIAQSLKERIPSGLEDLLTSNLDAMAKSAGLVRDWQVIT